jgi:hypothetical protein
MESIKELRQMLQTDVMGHPVLQRVLSIYLTRPLLSTTITPNQVTAFMLLLGIAASIAVFSGWFMLGLLLIYLNVLFDAVDGEVARYKKVFSLRGIYLDLVNHLLTGSLFFIAVAFYAAGLPGRVIVPVLMMGMLGGLAQTVRRANGDLYRVIFVRQQNDLAARLGPISTIRAARATTASAQRESILKRLVRRAAEAVYDLHELAPMAIVFFLAYVADRFVAFHWSNHPFLSIVIMLYGLTSCLYLIREIVGGFNMLESRINALRSWFASK